MTSSVARRLGQFSTSLTDDRLGQRGAMKRLTGPTILSLLLTTTGVGQARPDFTGKWTTTGEKAGAPVETMTVTQSGELLTVETPSPTGTLRWTFKLDGSEHKNVTIQGNPPREIVDITTATWEGSSLVVRSSGRSNKEGGYAIKSVWSVSGNSLVVHTVQTSAKDGSVQRDFKTTYSK
jgi:hypothetical protein